MVAFCLEEIKIPSEKVSSHLGIASPIAVNVITPELICSWVKEVVISKTELLINRNSPFSTSVIFRTNEVSVLSGSIKRMSVFVRKMVSFGLTVHRNHDNWGGSLMLVNWIMPLCA